MAVRKPTTRKPAPVQAPARRPIAEWIAASLGLVLTLAVVGFTLWEGMTEDHGPPRLTASAGPSSRQAGGYVVPVTVRNASESTAAAVEVRGVLRKDGAEVEVRRLEFSYVPGRGETRGGLMFQADLAGRTIDLSVEGYETP